MRALPLPPRLSDFLLVHSRIYAALTKSLVGRRRDQEPVDWTTVSRPLEAIHERALRQGARMLILDSPELHGAAAQPTGDLALLQEFGARHGVEVIDVSEWLRGVDPRQIALDGCHFNAEGSRIVGERLGEYLLQHDLKPSALGAPPPTSS